LESEPSPDFFGERADSQDHMDQEKTYQDKVN